MAMIRRCSQLLAQQPKSVFASSVAATECPAFLHNSSFAAGRRSMVGSTQVNGLPLNGVGAFNPMPNGATEPNGNMTDTGMYNWRVAAINNALAQRGKAMGPLTVDDLTSLGHLDQYHYMGTEACDEAIDILGLDANVSVLDIGSGIGGPARYMAMKSGCDFTGVELQSDLNAAASDLTQRVGLQDTVRFVTGDFVERYQSKDPHVRTGSFDHMISLLVILHVPDRPALLRAAYDCLKPGGTFLIEDFALVGDCFTAKEATDLTSVVSAHTVSSKAKYIEELEAAGFVDIEIDDLSEPWTKWTKARHESYRAARKETVKMHGEKLFNDRANFYEVIDELFAGGNLGGVRITGRKRSAQEAKLMRGRHTTRGAMNVAVLNELGSTLSE